MTAEVLTSEPCPSWCAHRFRRDGWAWGFHLWPFGPSRMWRCVDCGMRTTSYDGTDAVAGRPIHKHMSVAVPGYNTVPRSNRKREGV